jgi:hypothetical protein
MHRALAGDEFPFVAVIWLVKPGWLDIAERKSSGRAFRNPLGKKRSRPLSDSGPLVRLPDEMANNPR